MGVTIALRMDVTIVLRMGVTIALRMGETIALRVGATIALRMSVTIALRSNRKDGQEPDYGESGAHAALPAEVHAIATIRARNRAAAVSCPGPTAAWRLSASATPAMR